MNAQLGQDMKAHVAPAKLHRLRTWQVFVLVMVAMLFGTVYQSSLDLPVATHNRLAALGITIPIALAEVGLMLYIMDSCGHQSLPELLPAVTPRWMTAAILLLYAVVHICYAAMAVRYQSEGIAAFMLETTPSDVIGIALLLTATFLLQRGIRQLARVSELLFWIILIPLVAVFLTAAGQMDKGELRTLLTVDPAGLFHELMQTIPLVFSLNYIFFFYGASKPEKKSRGAIWGGVAASLSFLIAFLLILVGTFSLAGIARIYHPMGELVRVINASPYSLFERLDLFFLATRTMLVTLNLAMGLYAACRAVAGAFGLGDIRGLLPAILALTFLIASLTQQIQVLIWVRRISVYLQWALFAGVVPLLALWVRIMQQRGRML